MADGEPLVLRELGGQLREVVLEREALPEELPLGIRGRRVQTHYPGARRASVQRLGTSEATIQLAGMWDDVHLGVGGTRALVFAIRALVQAQHRLELQWGDIVRRGDIGAFDVRMRRDGLAEWELTFEPDESDDPEVLAPEPPPPDTEVEAVQALDQVLAELTNLSATGARLNGLRALA